MPWKMWKWLVGTLLATSGLILLVLLVREPVRKHFGARIAYGLWLIPIKGQTYPLHCAHVRIGGDDTAEDREP